jgi:signal transduction histidine kinase
MLESLASRLLLWHTAIVALVIAVFGGTICYLVWRARLVDIDATLAARAVVLSEALRPAERGTFDLTLAPSSGADAALYHALWTRDGKLIDRSDDDLVIPIPPTAGIRSRDGRRELTVQAPSGAMILVGRTLADLRRELWSLAALLLAAGTAVLALSTAGGWFLAGRALAPINRINRTARQMTDGDLSARIPVERVETELEQVARALNGAFDRLQASLDRQRRLSADVSHELRTPLAALSAEVQWALGRERPVEDYREALAVCQRAAGRMQGIVERLLSIARSETTGSHDVTIAVALDQLVQRAIDDLAPLAASRNLKVTADLPSVNVTGDPARLLEAVTNVIANAIFYNVEGGRIAVTLKRVEGRVELSIADTGVGIDAKDQPFIFDPFFRADHARSRDAGGAGLGLAMTRETVEQHGGSVACSSQPGQGTTVVIRLPVSPAA